MAAVAARLGPVAEVNPIGPLAVGDNILGRFGTEQTFSTNHNGVTSHHKYHDLFKGKVVVFFVPGAFTPTCSRQLEEIIALVDEFARNGIRVCILSTNQRDVLDPWVKQANTKSTERIYTIPDFQGDIRHSLQLSMNAGHARGLGDTFPRGFMYLEDGVVKKLEIEDKAADICKAKPSAVLDALKA